MCYDFIAEFPATPLLYEELNVVVSDAWAVERDINRALEDGSSSVELLGELTVKVMLIFSYFSISLENNKLISKFFLPYRKTTWEWRCRLSRSWLSRVIGTCT